MTEININQYKLLKLIDHIYNKVKNTDYDYEEIIDIYNKLITHSDADFKEVIE